ncbi:MAG: energy transducer TonB [Deltaproteobacteria bacterium]|nr:energy transducer TonB [Deltaproteobacteria bacterium]MBW2398766.1 energy transducer TonB [Deltaproteobacteria bacterium]
MGLRFPAAVAIALLVTFGLFWTMQALIGVGGELKEGRASPSIEFVRLKRDSRPVEKKREPPKREKPDAAPPPPEMNLAKNMNPSEAVGEIIPMADTEVELGKATALGAGGGDSDVVPLVRVDPQYPPKARQRRIEGYVDIEFTISPAGTVQNAKVIGASPPSVFDQSALRAVRRWRYNPKVVDGSAVVRHGVKVRLRFKLSGG